MIDCLHGLGPAHMIIDLLMIIPVVAPAIILFKYRKKKKGKDGWKTFQKISNQSYLIQCHKVAKWESFAMEVAAVSPFPWKQLMLDYKMFEDSMFKLGYEEEKIKEEFKKIVDVASIHSTTVDRVIGDYLNTLTGIKTQTNIFMDTDGII